MAPSPHVDDLEQTVITTPRRPAAVDPFDGGPAAQLLDLVANARPVWHRHAACRGQLGVMVPDEMTPAVLAQARELCAGCPVQAECAAEAASWPRAGLYGVWAGKTRGQRTRRRRRPSTAA